MIEEDYISFKIAKLLKEKGFNEVCRTWYFGEDRVNNNILIPKDKLLFASDIYNGAKKNSCIGHSSAVTAPTLQMATKWLRVVHKIDLCVFPCYYDYCLHGYECKIYKNKEVLCSLTGFKNYEEAMDAALLLVLDKDSKII